MPGHTASMATQQLSTLLPARGEGLVAVSRVGVEVVGVDEVEEEVEVVEGGGEQRMG